MLKFRMELDFFRAIVSNRSNYSIGRSKLLPKMINVCVSDNRCGSQYVQTQGLNTCIMQCNVIDRGFSCRGERTDGTNRENDSDERIVGDLQSVKKMLRNVFESRNQHISSWLIEKNVKELCTGYASLPDAMRSEILEELSNFSISQHLWFFTQIGKMEKSLGYLVNLREDLIKVIAKKRDENSSLGYQKLHELNSTLLELLSILFSNDFLELDRITWKSPGEILEKVSNHERVHPVRNWADLRRRLGPYRRCFAFLHRSMPGEPIIIIHVALTDEISSRLTDILSQDDESATTTGPCDAKELSEESAEDPTKIKAAVFYSLSLAHEGLNGIGMSYDLIRRVGQRLQNDFPGITKFSTLSPIHHFKSWFLQKLAEVKSGHNDILFPEEVEKLQNYFNPSNYLGQLDEVLSSNAWTVQETLRDLLQEPLTRLCARYLYLEKTPRGYAIDGAANLHLKNGAVMWRINWFANPYARGLNSSLGIMVNYRYYLDEMEKNGKEYQEGKKINASEQVTELVKSAQKLMLNPAVKSKI